jgi:uncharacterized protein (TIGR02598 family)
MKRRPSFEGFSLVEVTIALAVLSFCLLTLLALLPIGLNSTTDSLQKTSAAGIASQIAADVRDTTMANSTTTIPVSPRYGLALDSTTGNPSTNSFYLDDTGNPTGAGNAAITTGAVYKATVVVSSPRIPPTGSGYFQNQPTSVRIIVTWPAQADATPGVLPTHYQGSYESVTEVDRN